MQSFYPSPSRRRRGLALLATLVLALHGWVLLSLSDAWPRSEPPAPLTHWRLQMPVASAEAAVLDTAPSAPSPAMQTPAPMPAPEPAVTAPPADHPSDHPSVTEPMADVVAQASLPATPSTTKPSSTAKSAMQFTWPPSTKLIYEFAGESKGVRYSADGDMLWIHNNNQYQLQQEVRHLLMGSRSQTSTGSVGASGLMPMRFGDKGRQEVAAHFERHKGQVSFSANTPTQSLQEGAQDRLSLFVQLAALLAGSPQFQQVGQQISFQVVSARSAELWAFSVDKTETLKLPIGPLHTLKLSRVPLQQYDQTVEMWLSPQHGFLPARVRIVQTNGDVLDQFLSKVQKP